MEQEKAEKAKEEKPVDIEPAPEVDTELSELESLKNDLQESNDRFMRAKAELENFRRRTEKEKTDLIKYGQESFFKELLPVLDSFEKAMEQPDSKKGDSFFEGIKLVAEQLTSVLRKSGLQQVAAQGEAFDPNLHQAIQRVEKEGIETEMVEQEFAKGYTLNERLIRPAMVTVAAPKK